MARERNRRLYTHAAPVMEMLFEQIVDTAEHGRADRRAGHDPALGRATTTSCSAPPRSRWRPGVNWAEQSKGTNAIGTALIDETPTLVHADEHFMHANRFLTCSAAPIFDPRGNMLGVLDVTGDQRSLPPAHDGAGEACRRA